METDTTDVTTPDGRTVCVESGGDPDGLPVLVHGGTPNSRHLAPPWLEDAERRGVHLISYDRPGYGGSTPQPGRSVADCITDVRAIAGAFGLDRLAVWGISGGGPHALACAALLPDLVCAVASLASLAPYGAPGLDYFTGMGQDNLDDTKLFFDDREAARAKTSTDREQFMAATPELMQQGMASLLSAADLSVMTAEVSSFMVAAMQDGLAPGDEGWWDDCCAHLGSWGFELDAIRVPVQLWHGVHDQFVPFQHGQWLAAQIPGVEPHLTETDGHLTLMVNRVPEVHEWLLRHF